MLATRADQGFIEDRVNSWLLISQVAVCFYMLELRDASPHPSQKNKK